MKPVQFEGSNVTFAKDQPEYLPLPSHLSSDGVVTSCWELSEEDLMEVIRTKRIYFQQHTFCEPLQPQLPSAFLPQLRS